MVLMYHIKKIKPHYEENIPLSIVYFDFFKNRVNFFNKKSEYIINNENFSLLV